MTAIFGASKHPVLVKKIKIRSWPLRSEIQAIIQNQVSQLPEGTEGNQSEPIEIQLRNYFQSLRGANAQPASAPSSITDANILPFPAPDSLLQAEAAPMDEMEKAMAEAMQGADAAAPATASAEPNNETPAITTEQSIALEGQTATTSTPAAAPFPPVAATRLPPVLAEGVTGVGSAFLNDLTMIDICFFSSECYRPGQTVVIEFLIPMHFMVTVEIVQCRRYNMRSRVISTERGEFRIYAKLIFLHPGERTYLRRFLKSIEPEIKVLARPKKEADNSGGLEDLADLGL